jgi:hypothetical protein
MKPHPRIRKTIKWGGLVLILCMLAAWNISRFTGKGIWYRSGGFVAYFSHGSIELHWADLANGGYVAPQIEPGIHVGPGGRASVHGPHWYSDPRLWQFILPLEVPIAVVLSATILAWLAEARIRRRAAKGFCPKCNYDRVGIAKDAVCPECGSAGGAA